MNNYFGLIALILINLIINSAIAEGIEASQKQVVTTNLIESTTPTRLVVMDFKIRGNLDIDTEHLSRLHQERLKMANMKLTKELSQSKQYDVVDEKTTKDFNSKVDAAIALDKCKSCELSFAKQFNAKQILIPWVYRLSNLVLTMHFVIIDVASGKTVFKKALDFRGDNDQSWERAIRYFVKDVNKP